MSSVSMNVSIHDTLASIEKMRRHQRFEAFFSFVVRLPFSWMTNAYTRQIKFLSSRLAKQCLEMNTLARQIASSRTCDHETDSFIDEDFAIREDLESMRIFLLDLRKNAQTGPFADGKVSSFLSKNARFKLEHAHSIFVKVITESYEAASNLEWTIAEHDADMSKILDGFEASSRQEVEAMFDRIIVE
ncbi:hypothetical protein [Janthinobacterium aquaticum]|uniref:hypothetical protein n=1 Tax=Janthinobacterium sp. FT58W TaxID=2654254 RepID=UPI00126524E9|nr:hypothetical protein [Janthinobacterium sp. FT58W]KAB8036624.1 hypothetical protein GCM43_24315 [Janthinobacterium sp. FT58W]